MEDDNLLMIQALTGCSLEDVEAAYTLHKGDVILTIDSLLEKPMCAGDKYIPDKPVIDTGMTKEQEERCLKGRDLQDRVNAVFSVAHSKTQTQQVPEAPLALEAYPLVVPVLEQPADSEPRQDVA